MSDVVRPPLLDAFSSYLRRVLDRGVDSVSVIDRRGSDGFAAGAAIVLAAGRVRRTMQRQIRASGLSLQFSGSVVGERGSAESLPIQIYDRWNRRDSPPRSASIDVLAVVPAYNEFDVIDQVIDHLLGQGVRVHVIDNWSTDGTFERVEIRARDPRVTSERFPAEGPTEIQSWEDILRRSEQVANSSDADWVMLNDCDEIHEAPWPELTLAESFSMVDHWGFNCVDHTIVNFRPVDDSWRADRSLVHALPWCEFGDKSGHFVKMNAWQNQAGPVSIATSGGHQALFPGRRVFPYKFLLRHYPIRSQEHGVRKVIKERNARWSPAERERGWHVHYDQFTAGDSFIWDASHLFRWDDHAPELLLPRLSGVGLSANPFPGEGPELHESSGAPTTPVTADR